MNVTLRRKKLKDGRESLYLDYYVPKAKQTRKKESLKLYLLKNPKTRLDKEHNKKILILAESIRSKRLLALQHEQYEFSHLIEDTKKTSDECFVAYFRSQTDKVKNSTVYGVWQSTLRQIESYCDGKRPLISDVDTRWIEGFIDYLKNEAVSTYGKKMSQNTVHAYYYKLKACLRQAIKDKIIITDPTLDIKAITRKESEREFLTLEELKAVTKVRCKVPVLKTAFLFSALTGLRWSDIVKLTWQEVQYSKEQGWYIRFRQKKTKGVETLPISVQARELLGDSGNPEELVLSGLKYTWWTGTKLQQWMDRSGITKKITFHCARHTFATLQLTLGTDIYTLSKMLGHRDLKTTQVYAKIIDKKKVEAANIIPNLNF
ncbi:site-specific integrase [Aquimarina latercula]|uniref:site-specific integrase n=1 Tax=Aquimarina latercula TaxID=987 RepID=UPI00041208AC|nr:site-specific integrase [Aquimarina latercula]